MRTPPLPPTLTISLTRQQDPFAHCHTQGQPWALIPEL